MTSENSRLGQLIKGYLFMVGKKETDLAAEIGLSRSKISAAIHGKYLLKRDHIDSIVAALAEWKLRLTEEDSAEFLEAWQAVLERPLAATAAGGMDLQQLTKEQIAQIREFLDGIPPAWLAREHAHPSQLWRDTFPESDRLPGGLRS